MFHNGISGLWDSRFLSLVDWDRVAVIGVSECSTTDLLLRLSYVLGTICCTSLQITTQFLRPVQRAARWENPNSNAWEPSLPNPNYSLAVAFWSCRHYKLINAQTRIPRIRNLGKLTSKSLLCRADRDNPPI